MWSQGQTEKEGHQQLGRGHCASQQGLGRDRGGAGGRVHRAHVQPALWERFESSESEELEWRMGLQELELYCSSNRK